MKVAYLPSIGILLSMLLTIWSICGGCAKKTQGERVLSYLEKEGLLQELHHSEYYLFLVNPRTGCRGCYELAIQLAQTYSAKAHVITTQAYASYFKNVPLSIDKKNEVFFELDEFYKSYLFIVKQDQILEELEIHSSKSKEVITFLKTREEQAQTVTKN